MTKEQSQKTSDIPLKDLKKNPLHTWVELKEKEKEEFRMRPAPLGRSCEGRKFPTP